MRSNEQAAGCTRADTKPASTPEDLMVCWDGCLPAAKSLFLT